MKRIELVRSRPDNMPGTPVSLTIPELEFKEYCEDEDFSVEGKPEPYSCSQTVIYYLHEKKWWIKITFKSTVSAEQEQIKPIWT